MCAIAGLIHCNVSDDILNNMLKTMHRRGPDDNGKVVFSNCTLLHSRLAIIDLQGGRQPMQLTWGGETYTLVYNGELYNSKELRLELEHTGHQFVGHSDTEVILHAYAQWQEDCVEKLNGIFAFAVWESQRERLFLARDRIGVKPLFYTQQGTGFLFASEIKTLLCHPDVKPILDQEGAMQLLLLGPGRVPGSGVFHNITELEPGYCGYYWEGKWHPKQYWKLQDAEHTDSFEETAAYVRYLVEDSIQRQMISDVPIGTFLSGGLDSSIISAVAAKAQTEKPLTTFSVDYLNNDRYFQAGKFQPDSDPAYIQIMQEYLKFNHRWTVLSPEDLFHSLEASTIARDLPGMADVDFSLLAFCKEIRNEVKVALSGECADEIFGGYPWYRDPEIRTQAGFPWSQTTVQRANLCTDKLLRNIPPAEYVMDHYLDTCKSSDILPSNTAEEKRMKEMVNLNFRWFMQTLLDRKDRMSMYWGLEVRVPFCDYRIAEYLYHVPWKYKDDHGREKGLLRYAVQDLLPVEILNRKKSPYPKTFDPKYEQLVSDQLSLILNEKDNPLFHIVKKEQLKDLLNQEMSWPWYGQLMRRPQTIAYFLQLEFWLRHYQIQFAF